MRPFRLFVFATSINLACTDRDPPALAPVDHRVVVAPNPRMDGPTPGAPEGSSQGLLPDVKTEPAAPTTSGAVSNASASPSSTPSSSPTDLPSGVLQLPSLLDPEGHPLPQTDVQPDLNSAIFKQRMGRLLQSIATDQPEVGDVAFFPVLAYEQVKAIANPARDHRFRLLSAYHRNIHDYYRKIAKLPSPLTFLNVEPGQQPSRWMQPNSEGNRIGYHRMLRSQLKFSDGTGALHALTITSLISWRGEWYVVHLDGFK